MDSTLASKHIFLSYCHDDTDKMYRIRSELEGMGVSVWTDQGLKPGTLSWKKAIEVKIRAALGIVVILSPSANQSEWVERELGYASLHKIRIFPVLASGEPSESIPIELINAQWIDVRDDVNFSSQLQELVHAINENSGSEGIPPQVEVEYKQQKHEPKQSQTKTDTLSLDGIEFSFIPTGSFLMGSTDENELADADEKPQHKVMIPYDYWLAQFPVSNEQYSFYVAAVGRVHPIRNWLKKKDYPVVKVSHRNAMEYCDWLTELLKNRLPLGYVVRLPTEAEWEKAARGHDGREWPWGNQFLNEKQIVDDDPRTGLNCHCKENDIGKILPVDAYFPQGRSPYQIGGMAGNVWEWTWSLLKPYPYDPKDDGRENKSTPGEKVIRGGAFDKRRESVRCACRSRLNPSYRLPSVGFRVAIAPPIEKNPNPAHLAFSL